ncbi:MAG: alpha/beta fold hydrolase, partial [Bacteroidota bacterium]
MSAYSSEPIKVICSDGYPLAATIYRPSETKAAIMIAPATGIKRAFYHAFAEHLATHGYGVITFDHRGIGGSLSGAVSKSKASLVTWGRIDQTAILERLKKTFPGTTYHLVGHSAGGQLVGLMQNALDLRSIFNVACSSGSIRNMDYPFRFTANFFMNFYIPVSNLLFGHTKSQWVGMGEPLPSGVAAQWSKWCNGSGYVAVDLDTVIKEHHYQA